LDLLELEVWIIFQLEVFQELWGAESLAGGLELKKVFQLAGGFQEAGGLGLKFAGAGIFQLKFPGGS
jgi:hypothetical protein